MKIEVGKFYKTRDGRKAKVTAINGNLADFDIEGEERGDFCVFADSGRGNPPHEPDHETDLIAEWTEVIPTPTTNPFLKTVTETRVVDGSYVFESSHAMIDIKTKRAGEITLTTDHYYDKQSLAELARILAEISEAMA